MIVTCRGAKSCGLDKLHGSKVEMDAIFWGAVYHTFPEQPELEARDSDEIMAVIDANGPGT
jgi:hypothetical protein